jgi:gamma-glutamyltranspeptidase / glutathione hydrolase
MASPHVFHLSTETPQDKTEGGERTKADCGNFPIIKEMSLFNARRPSVHAARAMVATSQPLASQAGIEVLKQGGNAADAAIAIAAMVSVLEPMMTGLGGDVFAMVYWRSKNQLRGLNASGIQPRQLDREHFAKKNMKEIPQAGFESMNIPGAFDGWAALHEKYGSRPFDSLLAPAIQCAQEGFAVGEKIAHFWEYGASKLRLFPDSAAAYLKGGRAPKAGEIFRQPDLAQTLRLLGKEGRKAFYEGPIAAQIVEYCRAYGGGVLEMDDFKAQKCEWVDPISVPYHGYQLYEMPPNGQGIVALEALRLLEGLDLSQWAKDPVLYEHFIIEALKLSFSDGHRYIADPRFAEIPVSKLLSDDFIQMRRREIRSDRVIEHASPGIIPGDTTYFTVVDQEGNAVSFIMSISDVFGSGIVPKGLGIVMNNRGCELSLNPLDLNVDLPHKRPYHSIIPAMLFKDKQLQMSFGCMGGNMQPQGHVQILSNLIDRKMSLQEALDAPRIRVLGDNRVALEETFESEVINGLERLGHLRVTGESPPDNWMLNHSFARSFKGGAQAIWIDHDYGTLIGASDSRLDGVALGY